MGMRACQLDLVNLDLFDRETGNASEPVCARLQGFNLFNFVAPVCTVTLYDSVSRGDSVDSD